MRPRYIPVPGALMEVLTLPAADATDTLAAAVQRAGVGVAAVERREGYVESRWFDVARRAPTSDPFDHLDRIVKLRFFADPVAGHTRLFAECVTRIAWDPSVPQRELERMTDSTHAGRALLDTLLLAVKPFLFKDTTKAGGPPLRERTGPDTSKAIVRPQRP